jgi:SET domain-containing protein
LAAKVKTTMQHSTLIHVRKVKGKGRGVFAARAIKKGAVIERVPVVLVPIEDLVDGLENRTLNKYYYIWSKTHVAVSLGYGSLYNHSYTPNARYIHGTMTLTYRALRDIEAGEEITVNYNFVPTDKSPMRFKVV